MNIASSHLIPDHILNHPNLRRKKIEEMAAANSFIQVTTMNNETFYIFYDESRLLKTLVYFPYIQLMIIVVFVTFGYITFRSSKQDEQNPRLDRAGQGDGPSARDAHLVAAGLDRVPAHAAHRPDGRRRDEQGYHPADESGRPFLENRRGDAAERGRDQRDRGQQRNLFPHPACRKTSR